MPRWSQGDDRPCLMRQVYICEVKAWRSRWSCNGWQRGRAAGGLVTNRKGVGEAADSILSGLMCQVCGAYMEDFEEPGYPRTCEDCQEDK
ncbi:hypothetical protein PMI08_02118 [Brevibacillus sp. CF112]|nr:hypothetical protein PMI08_02118 [Brevibacillus sp. CF112]